MDKKESALVSIVIPVYNAEHALRRCLDSITEQTYTQWEAICVDDGSKDDSLAVLNEYALKDGRFCVVHQENGGVSRARNAGLAKATGELITFCDSDDFVDSGWLQAFIDAMTEDADLVVAGYKALGGRTETVLPKDTKDDKASLAEYLFTHDGFGYLWCKCFRRSIIEANNIRFMEGSAFLEDEEFVCKYWSRIKNVAVSPTASYNYFVPNFSRKYQTDEYNNYRSRLESASTFIPVGEPSAMLRSYTLGCFYGMMRSFEERQYVEAWKRLSFFASISRRYSRQNKYFKLIRRWNYPLWFPVLAFYNLLKARNNH